ncbi:hypothetical protein KI688_008816 [Linnemannia hyalina]|uniref:Crinkler effector protein N-terminal domain-containing protein n=1 Tax=Linnemannia hyalina TaxID=64524 RepID=A0A9P7Y1L8_9FUNG|nr:hypothetical protein KI688_008816 [Linnemannia hyalina]
MPLSPLFSCYAIKTKIPDTFKGVDAKDLGLWRVSIPLVPKKDRKDISLSEVPLKEELDETDDLSDVFPDKLPKKTIHVIIQRPPSEKRGALNSLSDLKIVRGTLYYYAKRDPKPPSDLVSEFDFVQCVPSAIRGEDQDEGPGSRNINVHGSEDRTFIPETTLQDLFSYDFGSTRILPPHATTIRNMGLPRGSPDLVCRKAGRNANVAGAVLFPIKIKRPVLLQSPNLAEDYREQERSGVARGPARAVKQAFGYMRLNGYSYGVLSTYEQTWFLLREGMNLMVSPTIAFNQTEPSFLQCYMWFIRQANADQRPLDPSSDQEVENILEDERQHRERGQKDSPYRSKMRRLKDNISLLRIAGIADGMEMLLVTDFAGTNICQERLEESDQVKIRAALSAIHDLGVVHGDILPQNIVVQRNGSNTRFCFVDFG